MVNPSAGTTKQPQCGSETVDHSTCNDGEHSPTDSTPTSSRASTVIESVPSKEAEAIHFALPLILLSPPSFECLPSMIDASEEPKDETSGNGARPRRTIRAQPLPVPTPAPVAAGSDIVLFHPNGGSEREKEHSLGFRDAMSSWMDCLRSCCSMRFYVP